MDERIITGPFRLPHAGAVRLGFGISGPLASPVTSTASVSALVARAHGLGVRLFDTAPSYGDGEAERRLGAALSSLPRDSCLIATKAGIHGARVRDFSAGAVQRSVDASLQRLGTSYLDLLLLHGPAPHELSDELLGALTAMRTSGRVRALGVAGRGAELEAAVATGEIHVVMAPVNARLLQQDLDRLARLKAAGAQLIGIETLAAALPELPAPTGVGAAWRLARGMAHKLRARGARPAPSPALASPLEAIRWSLGPGGADLVLTTTTRAHRLAENVEAARQA